MAEMTPEVKESLEAKTPGYPAGTMIHPSGVLDGDTLLAATALFENCDTCLLYTSPSPRD